MKILNHVSKEKSTKLVNSNNFEIMKSNELDKVRGGTSDPDLI